MTQSVEKEVHQLLIERRATLSLAESCTGGALAARLTRQAGCSKYFLGSVVAYSNELKMQVLGVKPQSILQEGAVSQIVVEQMVKGILYVTGSDYAIAVSGIAGPGGGTPSKPVGTVWLAIGQKKDPTLLCWQRHFLGSREAVIEQAVDAALMQLFELIKIAGKTIA